MKMVPISKQALGTGTRNIPVKGPVCISGPLPDCRLHALQRGGPAR